MKRVKSKITYEAENTARGAQLCIRTQDAEALAAVYRFFRFQDHPDGRLPRSDGERGLVVIGVSLDEKGPSVVKQFMKEFEMNYPVIMGDAKIVQDFGGVASIPTTFIIDRAGNIIARHVGYVPKETFENEITPLL